jgi:hypothetical protein
VELKACDPHLELAGGFPNSTFLTGLKRLVLRLE